MDGQTDLFAAVLKAWAPVTFASAWPQLMTMAGCVVLALGVKLVLRSARAKRKGKSPPTARWPSFLIVFTTATWLSFAGWTAIAGQAEPLRMAALAASAVTGLVLVQRFVGVTPLGLLFAALSIALPLVAALHLSQEAIAVLSAEGLDFGGIRITPWFAIKSIAIVGGLFWGAQKLGDLLAVTMANERVLTRSGSALFNKLLRAALFAAAAILSLAFLGVDTTALAVLSGAIGLGLGFGLQKVVSNYVAGLILLLDRSIKPGDVIELDFGTGPVRGEVTELAGRFTAITLRSGTETLIPNEFLISTAVNNWSHSSRNVQVRLPVGVAYSTDVERAMALSAGAAARAPRVLPYPAPVCLIVGFGDSAVEFEVRFWISDSESGVKNVSSGVYLEVWKSFRENGIEIPFPQRDLHIRSSIDLPRRKTDSAGSSDQT